MANKEIDNSPFSQWTDLAAELLGGKVLYSTDDFFAEKENLIKPGRGVFIPDKYTDRGKWMDGWESRRKRVEGHDWAVVQLAVPGVIKGFDIDTNHFLGNHPPHASIEATNVTDLDAATHSDWTEILPKSPLDPGSQHFLEIQNDQIWSHVRLHIYPDGGIARLRVYGEVFKDWSAHNEAEQIDLAAAINGAKTIGCNDMFFSDMSNLIRPGRGINMGDGWETKRNRTPNNKDWVIVKLAHPGIVEKVLVDTCHFKGNYPDTCSIETCFSTDDNLENANWKTLLSRQKLAADFEHYFEEEIQEHNPISHVRLNIFPDGGISRLRLFGKIKRS